jgi:hypothetical protein
VVLPFLKILPWVVLKWTAPVHTSYWEQTVGRMMLGWPKGDPAFADAVDVLAVLVVDVRKVVLVIFWGAAAESERRAARAGMMRNFMAKGEYK